jgi:hypothetical protein
MAEGGQEWAIIVCPDRRCGRIFIAGSRLSKPIDDTAESGDTTRVAAENVSAARTFRAKPGMKAEAEANPLGQRPGQAAPAPGNRAARARAPRRRYEGKWRRSKEGDHPVTGAGRPCMPASCRPAGRQGLTIKCKTGSYQPCGCPDFVSASQHKLHQFRVLQPPGCQGPLKIVD